MDIHCHPYQQVKTIFKILSLIGLISRIAEQMGRFLRVARQLTEEMARLEERLGDGLSAQVVFNCV